MTKRINLGLIGLGRLGRNYADYFVNRIPAANLMAISDIDQQSMDACASEFGISKCYYQSFFAFLCKEFQTKINCRMYEKLSAVSNQL